MSSDRSVPPDPAQPHDESAIAEIRHRAANHFQMLVSLLDIYARRAVSQETRDVLADLRRNTVALHLLYRRGTRYQGRAIEVDEYFRSQAQGWLALCQPRGIEIDLQVVPIALPVDQVTTLGLIADELVASNIKYAFLDERMSSIHVAFEVDDTLATLTVSRDGDASATEPAPGGLGRELLTALARQLRGSLDWTHDAGSTAKLKFPYLPWPTE